MPQFITSAMYGFRVAAKNKLGLSEMSDPIYLSALVTDVPISSEHT